MSKTRYVGRTKFGRVANKKTRYVGISKYGRVARDEPTIIETLKQAVGLGRFGKRNVSHAKRKLAIAQISARAALERFGKRKPTGAAKKLAELLAE